MFRSKLSLVLQTGGEACDSVWMRSDDWTFVRKCSGANVKGTGDKASLCLILVKKETYYSSMCVW